jgi:nucleoside-diphosphate-sugar epimerase
MTGRGPTGEGAAAPRGDRAPPVLITGASGFVGSHLAERLVADGRRVRALVREPDRAGWLRGLPLELVRGGVEDPRLLREAAAGVATIYHLAGATRAASEREFQRVNAGGTRRLLEAALEAAPGLCRFVLVSSQSAAGPSRGGVPMRETDPPRPVSAYGRSKLAAEEACRTLAGRLPVTILRPPGVYGPRDRDFLPLFRAVSRGVHPVVGRGPKRLCLVHVRDLVDGIVLAGDHPRAVGETFFIANPEIHEQADLGAAAGRALGRQPRRLRVPEAGLVAWAAAAHCVVLLGRRPALLNLDKVRDVVRDDWTCAPDKARRELGFAARTGLEEGFAETAAWYRAHGWLR